VTDQSGTTVKNGGLADYTTNATVTDASQAFQFTINYAQVDIATLPATFYYRITEDSHSGALANSTAYVVEVTVSETEGEISAAVTGMWKDGTEITDPAAFNASFANTLVSDLSLEKRVTGVPTDSGFVFSIEFDIGESGVTALPTSYDAEFYQNDGTKVETSVSLNADGCIVLSDFKNGEKAVIHGIPIGAKWTITETDSGGYNPSYVVNGGAAVDGLTASGGVTAAGTQVVCTNSAVYELPETGGAGTWMYTGTGVALIISAACLLYKNNRRREDERYFTR